jgi:spore germination protein YaaH
VPPALSRARKLVTATALEMGATEEEAEQAAFLVPDYLAEWKSPHQEAFEAHLGEAPTDFDPDAQPIRVPKTVEPETATKTLPKAAIAPGKRVLGWHPYWATTTDIQNYQYSNLTTIAYFSYAVNSTNGNADSMGSWTNTPLVDWAYTNNVKVVLTATLFGDAATHRFLTNSVACSNLITKLLIAMTNRTGRPGMGVNIDFEGVGSWTGATAAMTSFMSNLTMRFKAANPNYEVSIALPSVDWYANFAVSNYAAFGMDYAIIMGYDYYYSGSSTPGPVAPLFSSAQWIGASSWCSVNYSMNYYLGKGIPSTNLMLGVPYYGRRWAAASTNLGAASLGSAYSAALTYGACESEAAKWGKKWDNNASVPYYVYTSNSTAYQCFYDDTASLGMKYDLSNTKNMGGIGIWNLTQGSGKTELWSLIDEKFGVGAEEPGDPGGATRGGIGDRALDEPRFRPHREFLRRGQPCRPARGQRSGRGHLHLDQRHPVDRPQQRQERALMNVNGDGPFWVAVGEGGAIVTSTNGLDWVSRTSPTNALFRWVAYGNGVYVACGDNGAIVRSTTHDLDRGCLGHEPVAAGRGLRRGIRGHRGYQCAARWHGAVRGRGCQRPDPDLHQRPELDSADLRHDGLDF